MLEATKQWRAASGCQDTSTSPRQSMRTKPILQRNYDDLLNTATEMDRARLQGCSAPGDAAWLNALPSASLGLRLNDQQLKVAVSLRLGSILCAQHTCHCGSTADTHGVHALSCKRSKGRHVSHQLLNDVVCRAAQIPATNEPVGLSHDGGK